MSEVLIVSSTIPAWIAEAQAEGRLPAPEPDATTNTGYRYITWAADDRFHPQGRFKVRLTQTWFPSSVDGALDAVTNRDDALGGRERDPEGWLGYKPHRDDYADHGPKPSSETGKVSKRTEGRHNTAAQYLAERDELHPGDEIKTSVDSLRSILGAAAHMHMTHIMDDRPLGTLHVFRGVTKEVSDYILDTFGIDVLAYEGVEGT